MGVTGCSSQISRAKPRCGGEFLYAWKQCGKAQPFGRCEGDDLDLIPFGNVNGMNDVSLKARAFVGFQTCLKHPSAGDLS